VASGFTGATHCRFFFKGRSNIRRDKMQRNLLVKTRSKETGKIRGKLWLLSIVILCVFAGYAVGEPQEPGNNASPTDEKNKLYPIQSNPFKLEKENYKCIVPGGEFKISLTGEKDIKTRLKNVFLISPAGTEIPLEAYVRDNGDLKQSDLVIEMLEWEGEGGLKSHFKPSFFQGIFQPYKADLIIEYKDKDGKDTKSPPFPIKIPEPFWARFWAITVIIFITIVAFLLINKSRKKNGKKSINIYDTFFYLALTKQNRFSLSKMQIVIWSYVIIFGLVFVWIMTQKFLVITPQVLILLGIGGVTAAAAKVQKTTRLSKIDPAYRVELEEKTPDRTPTYSDLITTSDGYPCISKFQMLFFTLIIAIIVFIKIANQYSFPELSTELVALMGVSGGLYLGKGLGISVKPEDINKKIASGEEKEQIDKIYREYTT
jgi:hypothetical protein